MVVTSISQLYRTNTDPPLRLLAQNNGWISICVCRVHGTERKGKLLVSLMRYSRFSSRLSIEYVQWPNHWSRPLNCFTLCLSLPVLTHPCSCWLVGKHMVCWFLCWQICCTVPIDFLDCSVAGTWDCTWAGRTLPFSPTSFLSELWSPSTIVQYCFFDWVFVHNSI